MCKNAYKYSCRTVGQTILRLRSFLRSCGPFFILILTMAVFQTLLAQMSEKSDGKFTLPSASPSSSSSSSSSFSSSTSSSPSFNASAPVPAAPGAYKEPFWSAVPQENYGLEVIKEGTIVETIDLSRKPYYVFGRLPNNDVTILHPSLSRRFSIALCVY